MIPKVLHWIWLSDEERPPLVEKCVKSWDFLKGFKIRKWTKDDFDFSKFPPYVQEMYDRGLYAFASDYIRMYVIYKYGGLYIDSDAEIIRGIDDYLDRKELFIGDNKFICGFFFGSEKHNPVIKAIMDTYYDRNNYEDINLLELRIPKAINKFNIKYVKNDCFVAPFIRDGFYVTDNTHILHHQMSMYATILEAEKQGGK